MPSARLIPLVLSAAVAWPAAAAQSWRTVESARQLRDSAQHRVHVQYGAGRIDVGATNAPLLYSMTLRYDEATTTPIHRYDADARTLTLGVEDQSSHFRRNMGENSNGEMRLALSRSVPIDLQLELGATKAQLDLGGLSLLGLHLESGASETLLDFSTPNQTRMRALEIDVGAASLEVRNLGNANAASVHVKGGVGSVELDFAGVSEIGQAFADELFRVFARAHPEIRITPINTEPAVARMIRRVLSEESARQKTEPES